VCEKAFSRSGDLDSHMRVHTGEKPYKCHVCDKAFSRFGNLHRHKPLHTADKPHKCSLCNKSFSESNNLQQHKCRVCSNRKPCHCPYCGTLFKTIDEVKCHARIHTGAKPYSCRHCSQHFTRPGQLKQHLLKSHNEGTWFACHICQKKFSNSIIIKTHLR